MPLLPALGLSASEMVMVTYDSDQMSTPQNMMDSYSIGASRTALAYIGGQSSSQPANRVQRRNTILVAKVSKASLWTLIAANLFYAIVGIVLTVFAIAASSRDTRQLQTRLSISGLVAEIFEKSHPMGDADNNEMDLFRENVGLPTSRISVGTNEKGDLSYLLRQ